MFYFFIKAVGNTVVNNNVSTTPNVPPGFLTNNTNNNNDPHKPAPMNLKSMFSNNSMVYYKKGSLSSGGVGTVKNSRHKFKHT